MQTLFAVAAGGAIGASGRYLVGKLMFKFMGAGFPWATLTVNILGSFLIGLLVTSLALKFQISTTWQGFLVVGILGGFTTFSSFALEIGLMLERNEITTAAYYAFGSLIIGVAALFAGLMVGRNII